MVLVPPHHIVVDSGRAESRKNKQRITTMDYLAQTFSYGKYSKPQSILSIYTQIQGVMYMIVPALIYRFPVLARSYFFMFTDTHVLSDAAVQLWILIVFNLGYFYFVAGRANNREFILASGLNRIPLVVLVGIHMYNQGLIDFGVMFTMLTFDTSMSLFLLGLIGTYGIEGGFRPLGSDKKK